MTRDPGLDIFNSQDWSDLREDHARNYDWFDGTTIAREILGRDPETGMALPKYPLALNPIAKVCRVMRNVLVGTHESYTGMPIKMYYKPEEDSNASREMAQAASDLVNRTWIASNGGALWQEAGLLSQIYGGHAFKVVWKPKQMWLPYGIQVLSIKAPWIFPVYDPGDPWTIQYCYIGYMISAEDALETYGIDPHTKSEVLYLEHWTPTYVKITVDGIVPEVDGVRQEEEHGLGVVPIVYFPHHRDGKWYGRSHVPPLIGLTREKNGRMADRGDAAVEYTHQTPIATDVNSVPKQIAIAWGDDGKPIKYATGIGNTKPTAGAKPPSIEYPKLSDIPESVVRYDMDLWTEIAIQADMAIEAIGIQDTTSGRITGPVTNYRMWPTTSHTQIERVDASTALKYIGRIIQRLALKHKAEIDKIDLDESFELLDSEVVWPPQMPMDAKERNEILTSRLQASGISLITYLTEQGEQDPAAEERRVWADMKRKAKIEAEAQAAASPQPDPQAEIDMAREKNDAQIEMMREKHDAQLGMAKETHDVQVAQAKKRAAQAPAKPPVGRQK